MRHSYNGRSFRSFSASPIDLVSWQGGAGKLCALALAVGAATGARAQAPDQVPEEVLVTGTRIQATGMDTPTPVTSVTLDELGQMQPGQLVDSLSQLPVFFNNQRPQTTGFPSSAGSNLDLRGVGATRTLVLLDGRRVPSGNRFGTANVSALPEGAIRNVETVTGGASAAYGTDAVAGVVNFILDKDFEGFRGHLQAGQTSRSDGDNHEVGATWGRAIGEKGHILVSGDLFDQDKIISPEALKDRSWFKQRAWVSNPNAGQPGQPTFITRDFVRQTNISSTGIINQTNVPALDKLEFFTNNGVTTTQQLQFSGVGSFRGGCNCMALPAQDPTLGMDADNAILNENSRHSLFAYGDYDVSDDLTLYGQWIHGFARVKGPWFSAPILVPPVWQATIFSGNPYLPASVQAIMAQTGAPSFGYSLTGSNLWDDPSPIGTYTIEQDDTTNTGTFGFELDLGGDGFFSDWSLRGYTQFGENQQKQRFENGIRMGRLPLSLDAVTNPATGQPACRAALVNPAAFGDCVPVNLFGGTRNVSAAAAAYLVDPEKIIDTTSKQYFTEVVADGQVARGWAGPILMAMGASHRKDEIYQFVPDLTDEFVFLNGVNTGFRGLVPEGAPGGMLGVRPGSVPPGFTGASNLAQVLFTGSFQTPDTVLAGSFQVREAFAEINVPLLADKPAARRLDANFAYRWADYTGSGGINSWKYGLSWQIVDSFRFRATGSRDVRAATLRERFDATAGGAQVLDPAFNNAQIGTASRSGGNPNVNPEEADTVTFGVVYQPDGLPGFSVSADWYKIDINDALGQLSFQNIVNGCFNGAQDLCRYVIRDPVSNGIVRIDSLFINISNQVLEGLDLELRYSHSIGEGTLQWRFFANKAAENSLQFPGAPRDFLNRERPKYSVATNVGYTRGPLSVFVNERWLDGHLLNRQFREGVDVDENDVGSWATTDLNITYDLPFGGEDWSLFVNVSNLFDKDPPQTPGALNFVGGTVNPGNVAGAPGIYDIIGRRFVIGANLRF
jgi:iron complex outermembrane recepter protein